MERDGVLLSKAFRLLQGDPVTDKPIRNEATQGMLLNGQCLELWG